MPDIGTMHQLNPEPPHIGTMHQLGPEPLHTGEIITPQAQAEEYAREAQESADNAALSAAAAQSAAETAQQAAESIAPALDEKADAIHTAAGPAPIVSIPDAAAAPVDALTVGIEPVQSGSGDPSPDNVRPISGWTGANVTRTGKNLLKNGIIPSSNLTPYTFANAQFFKSGSYMLSFQSTTATSWRYLARGFDSNGNTLSDGFMTGAGMTYRSEFNGYLSGGNITNTSRSITLNKDCYIVFGLVLGDVTDQTTITGAMFELGSTATAYEPYQGSTYDITFPSEAGTVYGGTLTVNEDGTGTLVIELASVLMSDLTGWSSSTLSTGVMRSTVPKIKAPVSQDVTTAIMDRRKAKAWSPLNAKDIDKFGISPSSQVVIPMGKEVESIESFLNEYGSAQLVYPLATPVTYQLSNLEVIETLYGMNNIWADAGDTAVEYKADTKLYIDKKFAKLQALILEH